MPYFTVDDIEVTVKEFIDKCDKLEYSELKQEIKRKEIISNKFNLPDQLFYDSLEFLKTKRHLLSLEEQEYIHSLASKLRYE